LLPRSFDIIGVQISGQLLRPTVSVVEFKGHRAVPFPIGIPGWGHREPSLIPGER
jgi:hypothetical protein